MPKINEAIRLAEASNWQGLQELIALNPKLARECDDYGMLPIHWASTENSAPTSLVEKLIEAYPEGVQVPNKAQLLPLHIAIRAKTGLSTIQLLVQAFPQSIWFETPSGVSPIALATQSQLSSDSIDYLASIESQVPEDLAWNNMISSSVLSPTATSRQHSWHTISRHASTPAILSPPVAPIEMSYEESDGNSSEENNGNVATPPKWMLMDECFICHVTFSMFKHRHHCRSCGMSICSAHSADKKHFLPGFQFPQRTCVSCAASRVHMSPPTPSPRIPLLRRQDSKLLNSLMSPKSYEKRHTNNLQLRVAELSNQVEKLHRSNMNLQQKILEQEEQKAETMLLITEIMTRVSVLELKNEKYHHDEDFDL